MPPAAGRSSSSPTSTGRRTGSRPPATVTFAANTGAGTGVDLNASANNAIAAAFALNGGAAVNVAAQFTFGGRTYLAIDQDARRTRSPTPTTCCSTSPA